MDMFQQDSVLLYGEDESEQKKSQTYDEVVKDLIMDEKQYLRDLNMIIKVFREILLRDSAGSRREIDAIFSNVIDVMELTMTFISSLEDTLEMTEEGNIPAIGPCFEELAEAEEFDVYDTYARDILSPTSRKTLEMLLPKQIVSDALHSCGKGFREAVKFCLPKLLLGPIYHCFQYFNYIEVRSFG
jgi:son of sevenless